MPIKYDYVGDPSKPIDKDNHIFGTWCYIMEHSCADATFISDRPDCMKCLKSREEKK
jgi:hypothetical protein